MASYRWDAIQRPIFADRFSGHPWIQGTNEWAHGIRQFPFSNESDAREWIRNMHRVRGTVHNQSDACPRVFISHRQADEAYALRVAKLAFDSAFDYWLDVIDLDPLRNPQVIALERRLGRPLLDFEKGILTAAIIEMALLNCTHVLAVMTANTAGSKWVPYEYGRVKKPPPLSCEASCWWDTTSLTLSDIPEYMYLGEIHSNEAQIKSWFVRERNRYHDCAAIRLDADDPGHTTSLP